MTDPAAVAKPAKILLATDLGPRCDRALDRAALLAKAWGAELDIIHVMEEPAPADDDLLEGPHWRRQHDPVASMRRRIRNDLAEDVEDAAGIEVHLATGDPADRIVEIAEREGCGLIVTGVARDEPLGRAFAGTTVNRLVRRSRIPVLVVRARARRPYASVLVATDFSETCRQALVAALGLFPEAEFTALHSLDLPRPPFAGEEFEQDFGAVEREQFAEFLDGTPVEQSVRARIPLVIGHGDPEQAVAEFAQDHSIDLTVVGSHGRGALFDALIGSMTKRLLENVEGDMLIIMDPRAR